MKKILLITILSLFGIAGALADSFVGYDGDCSVYFRPGYGYYEVCENQPGFFLGFDFDTIRFHHGFRHEGFSNRGFHHSWNGGHHHGH